MVIDHPKRAQMLQAAALRLRRHMHSFDPTTQATAAMSEAKADGKFKEQLEELFRQIVTDYDPAPAMLVALGILGDSHDG